MNQQMRTEDEIIVRPYIFLLEEYRTLRDEIKATKDRIFKIAGLSAAGMPSSYFFAQNNNIEILKMSLPFLIFAVMMLYLAENRSLMRCGKYIKDCIEPTVIKLRYGNGGEVLNKWKGWEYFLEENDNKNASFIKNTKRSAERISASFFYIFFIIHYIASVALSVGAFYHKYKDAGWYCSLTFWIVIGFGFLFYFLIVFPKSISTKA
ncbi:hypothetical protein VU08_06405 [Desulfobulbus sp. F5]|nr:hypothetical protein [Desulfobulbus sp. F5]